MLDSSLPPAPQPTPKPWHRQAGWRIVIVVGLLGVIVLWRFGTFDRPLSSIGLNAHECTRNGLGETFCGKELTERREQQQQASREAAVAEAKIKREGQESTQKLEAEQAKSKEESEALQAKTDHEIKAEQQQANELQRSSEHERAESEKQTYEEQQG